MSTQDRKWKQRRKAKVKARRHRNRMDTKHKLRTGDYDNISFLKIGRHDKNKTIIFIVER